MPQSFYSLFLLNPEQEFKRKQRTSIADGGVIEKRPPCNRSSLFIQRLKIYSDVQKSSFSPNQS